MSAVQSIFNHFENKLQAAGLCSPDDLLMGVSDVRCLWNHSDHAAVRWLAPIFDAVGISALLYAIPAEPYRSIIHYLAAHRAGPCISPKDCETRTFLHDLPVCQKPDSQAIAHILKRRKSVIIEGAGVVTYGSISMEQAYITFSSICFACMVKFFSDLLQDLKFRPHAPETLHERRLLIEQICPQIWPQIWWPLIPTTPSPMARSSLSAMDGALMQGPFDSPTNVHQAMIQAGKAVVYLGLVDSFFGNISCCHKNLLHISQTGSSLDQLAHCIDPCPLDESSCAAITASSELSAHMAIVEQTPFRTILHGHPPFTVILSMACDRTGCELKTRDRCHSHCPHPRDIAGIPVVPGEVGTGHYGLCHTIPPAIQKNGQVIVYGHGVFTAGMVDFNAPLKQMVGIENTCRELYRGYVTDLLS